MRKFLLLTYHFPPSQAVAVHRMLGLVRYLPEHGWQPIVVAPPKVPGEPEDSELLKLIPAGTPVYRVPFPQGLWGKIARRVSPDGCWLPAARKMCRAVIREHRPQAVFTTSPPVSTAYLGQYVKNKFGLPWIADYRDPSYANNPYRKVPISRFHWEARLEISTMRLADQIIANTPIMLQGFHDAYPQHAHKTTLITNGFDRALLPLTPPPPVVNQELTIIHAGELYVGRDPRPIFDAVQQLRQEHPEQRWRLRLLGQSHCGGDLVNELRQRGLEDCVSIEGQVEYARALQAIQDSHILLLVHTPGLKLTIPAKLYEYIAAGRSILALAEPDGDIAWVLNRAGTPHRITPLKKNTMNAPTSSAGVLAAGGVEGIKLALKELRCDIQANPTPVFPAAKTDQFSRQHMAELVAQCLDKCVPAPVSSRLSWASAHQPC